MLSYAILAHETHDSSYAAKLTPPDQLAKPLSPVQFLPRVKAPRRLPAKTGLDDLPDEAKKKKKLTVPRAKKISVPTPSLRSSMAATAGQPVKGVVHGVGKELPPGVDEGAEEKDASTHSEGDGDSADVASGADAAGAGPPGGQQAGQPVAAAAAAAAAQPPLPPLAEAPPPPVDQRGRLLCLPDGRQYYRHPGGYIYGFGRWVSSGRVASFRDPRAASLLSTNFSAACRLHAQCRIAKAARALGSMEALGDLDDSKLFAWLLDGHAPAVNSSDKHRQLWGRIRAAP